MYKCAEVFICINGLDLLLPLGVPDSLVSGHEIRTPSWSLGPKFVFWLPRGVVALSSIVFVGCINGRRYVKVHIVVGSSIHVYTIHYNSLRIIIIM